MKIAVFHELSFGGAKRACYELSKKLSKKFNVDLYYVDIEKDKEVKKYFRNVYYYNFLPKHWIGNDWKSRLYKDTIELFNLYKLHKRIAKDISLRRYDCVIVHPSRYTQAPFILRFLVCPTIYFCQEPLRIVYDKHINQMPSMSFYEKLYEAINRKIRKIIDKSNIGKADMILVNSLFSEDWVRASYDLQSEICYLGVDEEKFKPLNLKKEYDLLFFGSKNKLGGYDLLNEAVRLFKIEPIIKIIIKDLGEKDRVSDKELVREYNKSKIILALSRNEPFGLTVLEAMASGVPVIAINEGGFAESVVDGKTGLLVSRNAISLRDAIRSLLSDNNLRLSMGNQARENIALNWTWEKSVEKLEEYIKILTKK
ncbi:MAG: glycosyltransferase family 4 protein [Candidatus Levybacteria bacterium]|nr:glycosyltransferase family 4 protein [Candidatus Levybacteria bacterium]